jgi:hypothetical protein
MQSSSHRSELAALQERADSEQVFLVCKVAVAQAVAACRDHAELLAGTNSSDVKVTVRGLGPGLVGVKGVPDHIHWSFYAQSCLVRRRCAYWGPFHVYFHLPVRTTCKTSCYLQWLTTAEGCQTSTR